MNKLRSYRTKTIVTLLITTLFACEPEWIEPLDTYTIKKGEHGSGVTIQMLESSVLRFKAVFDESAVYTTQTEENQWDINKLLGFADCNSHHHENSARFGWRWLDGNLEIHAYTYVSGERITEYIGDVELNEITSYQINLLDDAYEFILGGASPARIPRENNCDIGAYYMLWPYFGGDETAPQDISIRLQLVH